MAKSTKKAPAKKAPAKAVKPATKKPKSQAAAKPAPKKVAKKPTAAKPKAQPKPVPKPKSKPVPKPKPKPADKPKAKPAAKAKGAKSKSKPAAKPATKAKSAAPSASAPAPAATKTKRASLSMEKSSKKSALRNSILTRKAATKPISFSLDEAQNIAKTVGAKSKKDAAEASAKKAAPTKKVLPEDIKPAKPSHVKAASLADILGFNPQKPNRGASVIERPVAERYKRYYKLLLELRTHLSQGIELHSEETLKRSTKDDTGDLSSYGQHMADAGTDTFDRDFALSLVSSEQEALSEIEAAIKRVYDGTYGICEITGKPIAKDRLLAVPFTRYSTEAQKDIERNRHRTRTQAGLFGEHGEDVGKIMDVDSGND